MSLLRKTVQLFCLLTLSIEIVSSGVSRCASETFQNLLTLETEASREAVPSISLRCPEGHNQIRASIWLRVTEKPQKGKMALVFGIGEELYFQLYQEYDQVYGRIWSPLIRAVGKFEFVLRKWKLLWIEIDGNNMEVTLRDTVGESIANNVGGESFELRKKHIILIF